ncbi:MULTISPECIES: hypothetical protein [Microbacterium]|uniref:hypothetical protein n=1 Tax=Microbacterium TaxID=33882 RepID=UPI00146BBEAB|nr:MULTISPECIES: hypothetical protein [Microbacterium]
MNPELTPREHADMRDTILAGAQRLRSTSQRRMQVIAASVAFVLVAGISGGAIATASLIGLGTDPGPVATPTATPDPEPSVTAPAPEPTVPPGPPAEGNVAFEGECENALSDGEVEVAAGIPMMLSDYRWRTGANEVLGGIDCVWVSDGAYLEAIVHLLAYPSAVVSEELRAGTPTGCRPVAEDGSRVECTQAALADDTWVLVRVTGAETSVNEASADGLLTQASTRLADHPSPVPATRTDEWWTLPDCNEVVAAVDPAVYGFERVALLAQSSPGEPTEAQSDLTLISGATSWCELHFTSGSGDSSSGEVVRIDVVPGGAIAFQTALDAADTQPVTVDGAQAAVIAPGLNRYEGAGSVVVATDGVNVLMVTPDFIRPASDAAALTSILLSMMHP